MASNKVCDGCGKIETEKKYFDQMAPTLPIYEPSGFTYDREKDLCCECRDKLGKIITAFLSKQE